MAAIGGEGWCEGFLLCSLLRECNTQASSPVRSIVCTWMYVCVFRWVDAGQLATGWFNSWRRQGREPMKLLSKCLHQSFTSCSCFVLVLALDFTLPRNHLLPSSPFRLHLIHPVLHLHSVLPRPASCIHIHLHTHPPFIETHAPPFFLLTHPAEATTTRSAKQRHKQSKQKKQGVRERTVIS